METDTRRIPRSEWKAFFEGFSRRHTGWLATLRILNPRLGAQVQARELPLEGIEADRESISIHMGERPERHIAHPVEEPVQAWVEVETNGAERALEIESATGTKTILEFPRDAAPRGRRPRRSGARRTKRIS
jgi:hypothetical protein